MDIREIYTEIITEESRNTKNKRYLEHPTHEEKGHNPSCGDEITLQLDIEDGIIKDARPQRLFTAVGRTFKAAAAMAGILPQRIRTVLKSLK